MIRELLLKAFIPVSRIFSNKVDIFIFSRNVRKSSASNEKIINLNINFKKLGIGTYLWVQEPIYGNRNLPMGIGTYL